MEKRNFKKKEKIFISVFGILLLISFVYLVLAAPTVNTVVLNSTSVYNLTRDNLTAYPSPFNVSYKYVYNWKINNNSILYANIPFDDSNGTASYNFITGNYLRRLGSPTFESTGGFDGRGAFDFERDDDEDRFEIIPIINATSKTFTISAWIKQESTSGNQIIVSLGGSQDKTIDNIIEFRVNGSGALEYGENNGTWASVSGGTISAGQYHHVSVTRQFNGTTVIYIDGVQVNTGIVDQYSSSSGSAINGIGFLHYQGVMENYFDGMIDEILIWNSALSDEQISAIYNNRTDLIVSQETNVSEVWESCVIPIYGTEIGNEICSNNLTIEPNIILNTISVLNETGSIVSFVDENGTINNTGYIVMGDNATFSVNLTNSSEIDSVWIITWDNIIDGTIKFTGYLAEITQGIWRIVVPTNSTFNETEYNYTVYANATDGFETSVNGIFNVERFFVDFVNPTPENGSYNLNPVSINISSVDLAVDHYTILDLDNSLLAWYRFENNSGEYLNDSSSYDNYLISDYPAQDSLVDGLYGKAFFFAQSPNDGGIDSINSINLVKEVGWTIGFWSSPDTAIGEHEQIITINDTTSLFIGFDSDSEDCSGLADVYQFYYDTTTGQDLELCKEINSGSVNHIVFTWNGTHVTGYINGTYSGSTTMTMGNITGNILLGEGTTVEFDGYLDEVVVFNRSLSLEEVASLYNATANQYYETFNLSDNLHEFVANSVNELGRLKNDTIIFTVSEVPVITSLILNTSSSNNYSTEDLTAWATIFSSDVNNTKVIYKWYENGASNKTLIMPFEYGSNDTFTEDYAYYDPYIIHGVVNDNVTYNATGGFDGKGAYEFAGINGGITNDGIYDAGLLDDMTFMAWGKYNNLTGDMNLVVYAAEGESSWQNYLYQLELKSNKKLLYMHEYGAGFDSSFTSTVSADIDDGEWHHYAFVRDISAQTIKIYVDGVQLGATGTFDDDPYEGAQSDFYLGKDVTGEYWNGTIDDVYIYAKVLTEGQIRNYYENQINILDKSMTSVGDEWYTCGRPVNNDVGVGNVVCSNILTVNEYIPASIDSVVLNSSLGTNLTTENLTAYPINITPNSSKVIYDWRKDGSSIAVLNMPFDGGLLAESETKVKDYSSFANNGTIDEAVYNATGGYDGEGAYEFDGVNDAIDIDYNQDFNFTGGDGFSVMAWVKPKDLVNNRGDIVSQYLGTDTNRIWNLQVYNGKVRFAGCSNGTLASCMYAYSGVEVNDSNIWHHLVGTWNGTALQIYVDGVAKDNTPPELLNLHSTNATDIRIGHDTASEWYNGTIDEVMIFNRSLNEEQILALYNNRTDLIISNETSIGENWSVQVTPNDNIEDGPGVMSNSLIIRAEDTCTCPSSPANWDVDMVDYCVLNSVCNISGYNLTFYGSGNFTVNSTFYINEILNLSSGMMVWMKPVDLFYNVG